MLKFAVPELFAVGFTLGNDQTLGPQVGSSFDFTLAFEDVVFTILPAGLFVLCLPHYVQKTRLSSKIVKAGYLFWAKIALGIALFISQVASTAVWANEEDFRTPLGIAARAISCLASGCVLFALYSEHFRSIRPSILLGLYLLLMVLFDIVRVRSLFLRGIVTDGALTTAAVGLRFALMCLEEFSKRTLFISEKDQKHAGREAVSGFCSRMMFAWVNPLLRAGSKGTIGMEDLDALDNVLQVNRLNTSFQTHWENCDKSSKYSLLKAILRTIGIRQLGLACGLNLLNIASEYAQPFIIKRVVTIMSDPIIDANQANGLIGATMLAYFAYAITYASVKQAKASCMTMVRSSITSGIFDQALAMYATDLESGAILTRITADITGMERIIRTILDNIGDWASLIIGIVYLGCTVGAATVLVVIPLVGSIVLSYLVGRAIKPAQKRWNDSIEGRISAVKAVLSNMRTIRMTGLMEILADEIRDKFKSEVEASKRYRFYWALIFAIELASLSITPVFLLTGVLFWTRKGSEAVTAADLYAIISVVTLILGPLGRVVHAFQFLAGGLAGHDRIQDFLLQPRRIDARENPNASPSSEKSNADPDYSAHLVKAKENSKQAFGAAEALFPARQFTAIVGSIGSGKTTLLKLLIGELPCEPGQVRIDMNQIAFCSQTAWIRNQPIKEFIMGQSDQDESWYQSIVQACCLDVDFDSWQQGDQRMAGNEGQNLSGGQKQRIALAKALFSRKKILVLDDIFSGLDKNTSVKIFDNLFKRDGLLRKAEATVILATNTSLTEHLQYADSILAIDKNHQLFKVDEGISGSIVLEDISTSALRNDSNILSATQSLQEEPRDAATSTTSNADKKTLATPDRSTIIYYLSSFGVMPIVLWLIWCAVGEAYFKSPNIFLRAWIETHAIDSNLIAGYAALGISAIVFSSLLIWYFFVQLMPDSYEPIHNVLLNTTTHATTPFLSKTDNGSILNRFSSDMTLLSQDMPFYFMYGLMFFFAVWVDLAIIASGAYFVATIFPVFAGFMFYIQRFYLKTSRQMRLLDIESRAPLFTLVNETVAGIEQIRASSSTTYTRQEMLAKLELSQKAYYMMFSIQQWLYLTLDMSVFVLATALVAFAVHLPHSSSPNGLGLALVNTIGLSQEIGSAIRYWADAETCIGALTRVLDFERTTPRESTSDKASVSPSWPEKGEIVFDNVSAQYDTESSAKVNALSNVSFAVQAGQKVGIVGRTGSGKSTLLTAILQMLPYEGSIQIDGRELVDVSQDIIRSRITTITQSSMLLAETVRTNINPSGYDVTDSTIFELLRKLGILDHIEASGGLDAIATSIPLSDGKRQVLNIARGMIQHQQTKSKVVLMDEITSQVDSETDKRIQDVVKDVFEGCTMLVIAHRIETLHDADLMLTVANGTVSIE